eukprot:TRINITY_DN37218_c0_g2_i2.p1 TRINITY_DN37218_c0_g2~~TRINITY_DN37218_c0_g2_i2.p1  ORF type:complete len:291 (-),score=59.50 TRINITY_DN37218_c0_g2_i2:212-1084(-)
MLRSLVGSEMCIRDRCTGDAFRVTHPSGMEAAATSICATIRLGCSITRANLKDFVKDIPPYLGLYINGAVYNPRRCPAVQLSTSHPETSVNLYSCEDGPAKLVCLGARTKSQARQALRRIARCVKVLLKVEAEFLQFTVANYIMSGDIKFEVNLDKLLKTLNSDEHNMGDRNTASYEPELSPKLAYHMEVPVSVKIDIFHTGKMNILRCLSRSDLQAAFAFLYPLLCKHKFVQHIEPAQPAAPQLALPSTDAGHQAQDAKDQAVQEAQQAVVSPHGEQLIDGFSDMLDFL